RELAEALGDPDAEVARRAARALRRLGPGAATAVPVLIQAFQRKDPGIRLELGNALGAIGPAAVPALTAALRAKDPNLRGGPVAARAAAGPPGAPALIGAIADTLPDPRQQAATVLERLGPGAAAAVPALARMLHDPDFSTRSRAAEALAGIGPPAVP